MIVLTIRKIIIPLIGTSITEIEVEELDVGPIITIKEDGGLDKAMCPPKGGWEQGEKGRNKPNNKTRQRNARLTFSCYRL